MSKQGHWRSPHLPPAGCWGGNLPSQLQTSCRDKFFFPHFQEPQFYFYFFFLFFSPLVRCIFALLSLHVCITFFSVPQNRSQGLAAGKYNQSNSYYFSMFHTVVFLLLLVFFFFFFFLSPPFFLRLEQIQYDWQEIGRLQRSRGSDFSSK